MSFKQTLIVAIIGATITGIFTLLSQYINNSSDVLNSNTIGTNTAIQGGNATAIVNGSGNATANSSININNSNNRVYRNNHLYNENQSDKIKELEKQLEKTMNNLNEKLESLY